MFFPNHSCAIRGSYFPEANCWSFLARAGPGGFPDSRLGFPLGPMDFFFVLYFLLGPMEFARAGPDGFPDSRRGFPLGPMDLFFVVYFLLGPMEFARAGPDGFPDSRLGFPDSLGPYALGPMPWALCLGPYGLPGSWVPGLGPYALGPMPMVGVSLV